jgi:predicted transcriptional regulator of viral defense system
MTRNMGPALGWAGQVLREGESYGGRPEERILAQVMVSHKRLQRLDQLRHLIKEGMTECNQIAQAMGVSKYTVSRLAKRAKKAGWLDTVKREYVIVNAEE